MAAKLVVVWVVVYLDCGLLDCPVHALGLSVGPRVVPFGQSVLAPVVFADHVKAHLPPKGVVAFARLLFELDAIVCKDPLDPGGDVLTEQL